MLLYSFIFFLKLIVFSGNCNHISTNVFIIPYLILRMVLIESVHCNTFNNLSLFSQSDRRAVRSLRENRNELMRVVAMATGLCRLIGQVEIQILQ